MPDAPYGLITEPAPELILKHTPERYDVLESPDELDITLRLLMMADPRAIELSGWTLWIGNPDRVGYEKRSMLPRDISFFFS